MLRTEIRSTAFVLLTIVALGWFNSDVQARGFRVGLIPNGASNRCANCHFNPGGGGARNTFGEDVNGLVDRGSQDPFWTPEFAAADSDGDGFTNGAELGDFDGDGTPERTVNITNPGLTEDAPFAELGDCNLDNQLNASDLSCVDSIDARDAVLDALNTLPGDIDGNGDISFADFLILSANFRSDAQAYSDGNINVHGTIDFADFLILSNNFGKTVEAASASGTASAVPEPSGCFLASIAPLALLARRSRRKR